MGIYLVLVILPIALSFLIGFRMQSRMKKYMQVGLSSRLTGKDIAEKMLRDYGINDVDVVSVPGTLTDHYNPEKKTVNLSPEVYAGRSVAAAAVAAHECGHAVQHATAYAWLTMRSKLVPPVSFASRYMQWILLAGVLTLNMFPQLLLAGIFLFAFTTLFSIITLPVEFDASRRALAWLSTSGVTYGEEQTMAKDGLKWAAMTYFIAAIASLGTLMYYVMLYLGRRD